MYSFVDPLILKSISLIIAWQELHQSSPSTLTGFLRSFSDDIEMSIGG
jgi:hypothetical protein